MPDWGRELRAARRTQELIEREAKYHGELQALRAENERLLQENRRLQVVAEAARSIRDGYYGPEDWQRLQAALAELDGVTRQADD